jgi:hypothetical protein
VQDRAHTLHTTLRAAQETIVLSLRQSRYLRLVVETGGVPSVFPGSW